jgi:putative transcriptional regulator
MFESITRDSNLVNVNLFTLKKPWIELDGRKFELPATLTRFINRVGEWSHLMGTLWQAPIEIDGGSLVQLIYMEKGGSMPEHTHKGNEITLVLDGQFDDGKCSYTKGDYVALDQTHTHTPVSNVNEGCLVMVILDKPLHFTAGWAKLINPLSQLYFKVNTH